MGSGEEGGKNGASGRKTDGLRTRSRVREREKGRNKGRDVDKEVMTGWEKEEQAIGRQLLQIWQVSIVKYFLNLPVGVLVCLRYNGSLPLTTLKVPMFKLLQ